MTALPSGALDPPDGDCLKMMPFFWVEGASFTIMPSLAPVRMDSAACGVFPTTFGTLVVFTFGGGAYGKPLIGTPLSAASMKRCQMGADIVPPNPLGPSDLLSLAAQPVHTAVDSCRT